MGCGTNQVESLCSSVVLILSLLCGQSLMPSTFGSEFPERECCDPVYPIPAPGPAGHNSNAGHGAIAPAAYPEHGPPPTPSITTEIPGVQTKTASAILNCVRAKDFCMDNTACSPILEIVPRVCGEEKVACTTLTVMKCQAALRTLQAFPYFFPTCLCREPSSDPACNAFREYLFDHPCSFVKVKEKDPYSVDALPTCDYALDVCRQKAECIQLYRDFKAHCRISDGNCKMDDWELCHNAWTKLRLSPMFGCICPTGNDRCERIFGEVNHNSCVASEKALADFTDTSSSALFSLDRHRPMTGFSHFSFSPIALFPALGTHIRRRHDQHALDLDSSILTIPAARTESHHYVDESLSTPVSYQGYPSPGSFTTSHSGSITVQVISAAHAPDREMESQLETPLLGSHAAQIELQNKLPPFIPSILVPPPPPKSTLTKDEDMGNRHHSQSRFPTGIATISSIRSYGGRNNERNQVRVPLHMTCSTALQNCQRSPACAKPLHNVIHWCDPARCGETCMQALQNFYRGVQEHWALEVAFCLCRKKSEHRHDKECLQAQGQLHPACAQRGEGISPPSCHSLAEACRAQPNCKSRLLVYETACAVDSVTKKCAGSTANCRNATIGILGTVLKKSCACNGTDYTQLYDCLGWQRILWVNPCVVESQRDFHRVRPGVNETSYPRSTTTTISQITTESDIYSHEGVVLGTDVVSTTFGNHAAAAVDSEATSERTTHVVTFRARNPQLQPQPTSRSQNPHPQNNNHNRDLSSPEIIFSSSTSTSPNRGTATEELTTLTSTTTKPPTSSTQSPRYCYVRRPIQSTQSILEGTSRRLYREDKTSCSELCTCAYGEPAVSCKVLTCLEAKHCSQIQPDNKTIVYRHEEPLYQTGRGRCICYEGRFICVKPQKNSYNLNSGVFLFLGFSHQDESVLNQQTGLEAVNVIDDLRKLIDPHFQHLFVSSPENDTGLSELKKLNGNGCRLGLFRKEFENLIINATVLEADMGNYTLRPPINEILIKEKQKCLPIMKQLSELVNDHHPSIHNHPLLSILKLAEVDENNIPKSSSGQMSTQRTTTPSINLIILYFLLNVLRHISSTMTSL